MSAPPDSVPPQSSALDASARRSLVMLIGLTMFVHIVFNGSRITISLYAISLGATPDRVGMILCLFGLLPMLLSISAGRLIDRIGSRLPMAVGAMMACVGALSVPLIPGLNTLYFASMMIGSGFMLFQIAQQNVAGYFGRPEDRPFNFSLVALGFAVSNLAGPLLAGFLIDHVGHVNTFAALGWLPIVTATCVMLGIPALPAVPPARPRERRHLFDLFTHRELRFVYLSTALVAMSWDLYIFVMPIYCSHIGLSATRIGLVIGTFAFATFCVRVIIPVLVRRLDAWQMLRIALAVSAAMYFLFPITSETALLMMLSFVLGLGLGSAQPMVMSLLHDSTPEGRVGEAVGLRSMLMNTSQTGLPLFFGILGSALGMTPVFWTLAALQIAGGEAIRRHQRRLRAAKPAPAARQT